MNARQHRVPRERRRRTWFAAGTLVTSIATLAGPFGPAPGVASAGAGPSPASSAPPTRLLIGYDAGVTAADRAAARERAGLELVRVAVPGTDERGPVELVTGSPATSLAVLAGDPVVRFAEPDVPVELAGASNDPYYLDGNLWGMYGASTTPANQYGSRAAELWAAGRTGSSTVYVGIVDSGIDLGHPDLAANVWTNPFDPPNGVDDDGNGVADDVHGWNTVDWDADVADSIGHGTHVAGTIGAVGGNGVGVVGMNWQVQLIAARAFSASSGLLADAILGIDYLVDLRTRHGLALAAINASWTTSTYSQALADAVEGAGDAGIVVVGAAGNYGQDNDTQPRYPASLTLPNVVAVAAIDDTGARASSSNYGPTSVDLGAPGIDVLSTWPRSLTPTGYLPYAWSSGTSMAAPHVTGAVALCRAIGPGLTPEQLGSIVVSTARATPSLAGLVVSGGRLDVSGFASACTASAVPAPPSDLTAESVSSSRIDLTWSDNSNNETGFTIERSVEGGIWLPRSMRPANTTSWSDTGLDAETTYSYRVRSYNGAGSSEWSAVATATTGPPELPTPPDPPSNLQAQATAPDRVTLTWTDNATNETGFTVQRSTSGGAYGVVATPGADATTWTDTGASPSTSFSYRVRAENAAGSSAWSNVATATTPSPTRMFTPVTPARLFDTRTGEGGVPAGKRLAGSVLVVPVTSRHGLPASGVAAVSLNVTVTQPDDPGYITVYGCGPAPLASNLNFVPGQTVPNAVTTPVSPDGSVCFYTYGRTHLLADVNGWYAPGAGFTPVTPSRLFDTRSGEGGAVWSTSAATTPRLLADPLVASAGAAELAAAETAVLVGYQLDTTSAERAAVRARAGLRLVDELVTGSTGRAPVDVVELPAGAQRLASAQALLADEAVRYAEPDAPVTLDAVSPAAASNDPAYTDGDLWGMYGDATTPANEYGSQAGEAWAAGYTGSRDVIVAVVDSGLHASHPDLAANLWTNPHESANGIDDDGNGKVDDLHGWDFFANDNDPNDVVGHGTHVAGTIGAVGGNATGVVGVAWQVSLLPLKVSGAQSFDTRNAVAAIDYVTDLKVRHPGLRIVAINASWGSSTYSQTMYDAVARARSAGILLVAAAGNEGIDIEVSRRYPVGFTLDNVVGVAAIDDQGDLASFSNYGDTSVDLAAPGVDILSTSYTGGYTWMNGTSMATPHVAGAVGLCASIGTLTASDIRSKLLATVIPTPSVDDLVTTDGRLDVGALAQQCRGRPPAGAVVRVPVTGRFGVPSSGVAAVSLNVTVTEPLAPGYVTVYGCGTTPFASNLNYVPGQTVPNAVLTPVAPDGSICLYTYASTHLLADLNGWFAAGSSFTPVTPGRLFDTRTGEGGVPPGRRPAGSVLEVSVAGRLGLPSSGIAAVSLNVTVTEPLAPGYVTVYGCGTTPFASNLNYVPGQTVPNAVITPVSATGTVCLYVYGATHLLADVNGWYAAT